MKHTIKELEALDNKEYCNLYAYKQALKDILVLIDEYRFDGNEDTIAQLKARIKG